MLQIPVNILPWLIGSVVASLLGLRGLMSYRKTKSPLSGYFALGGLFAAISWLLWSLPFILFSDNRVLMLILINIGDAFNFALLLTLVTIFWYLNLQKINFWVVGLPALLVALTGFTFAVYVGIDSPYPAIIEDRAVYPISPVASIAQAILIVFGILSGLSLMLRAIKSKGSKTKLATISIGLLFMGTGIGGLFNVLSGSTETNDSPVILLFYGIGISFFILAFLVFRIASIFRKS